jgi:ferredoxin-thioredoxin reductase catalytic subunit
MKNDVIEHILLEAAKLGFRPANNEAYKNIIFNGLVKKGGYCPCKVVKSEDTKCPCAELRTQGTCTCGLFEKVI